MPKSVANKYPALSKFLLTDGTTFYQLAGSDSGAGSVARQFVRFRLAARDSIFVAGNRITSNSTRAGSAALGERGQARFWNCGDSWNQCAYGVATRAHVPAETGRRESCGAVAAI